MADPRMFTYYAYRYLLVEESGQLTFFSQERPKEQLMRDFLEQFATERKLTSMRRNRKHLLIYVAMPNSDLIIGKLAKERRYTKQEEGAVDVEPVPDHEYPFVTFAIDMKRQLVLIQKRTSIFQEADLARAALEETIRSVADFGRYGLVLTEITPEGQFWDYVQSAGGLYELELTLHAPNFFEGLFKGDEIAQKVQELYGSTSTSLVLRNDRGGLKVVKEVLGDVIRFISVGGGRYCLRLMKKGEQALATIKSYMNTVEVLIRGEAESLSVDQTQKRLAEVDEELERTRSQSDQAENH